MNTKLPGIFIPVYIRQGSISIRRNDDIIPESSTKLYNALAEAKIKGDFQFAVRFCGRTNQASEYGLILYLEHPHQMEYQSALQIINKTFNQHNDELTIPINNVPASGLGIPTKSVYIEINSGPCDILGFNTQAAQLCKLLRQPFLYDSKLILSCTVNGFEIHGTSPVNRNASPEAWQQHLGKALRNAGYTPVFSQTWSTNKDIRDHLLAQCGEQ